MLAEIFVKMLKSKPDFVVGEKENPYLLRWYLTPWSGLYRDKDWSDLAVWQKILRSLPNVYLHLFLRSDDDRALHDHPWPSLSIILDGAYIEHMKDGVMIRRAGKWTFRRADAAHRLELFPNNVFTGGFSPVVTLFLTGFKTREWGFHCPNGWRHWKEFTAPSDSGQIGKGCE